MTHEDLSGSRVRAIRAVCILFALTSFVIGAWMMIDPGAAWASVGIDVGDQPFAAALYGGAIMGEGAMFGLAAIWPVRYLVFFQYLMMYKTFACIAGAAVLLRMEQAPPGAWLTLGGWAFAGLLCVAVFPWAYWWQAEHAGRIGSTAAVKP